MLRRQFLQVIAALPIVGKLIKADELYPFEPDWYPPEPCTCPPKKGFNGCYGACFGKLEPIPFDGTADTVPERFVCGCISYQVTDDGCGNALYFLDGKPVSCQEFIRRTGFTLSHLTGNNL